MTSLRLGADTPESAAQIPGGIESVSFTVRNLVALDGIGATVNAAPYKVHPNREADTKGWHGVEGFPGYPLGTVIEER